MASKNSRSIEAIIQVTADIIWNLDHQELRVVQHAQIQSCDGGTNEHAQIQSHAMEVPMQISRESCILSNKGHCLASQPVLVAQALTKSFSQMGSFIEMTMVPGSIKFSTFVAP